MEWVKLSSRYYTDPAIMGLPDEAAELAFVRSLAYCGAHETGGFIPDYVVPSLFRRRRYTAAVRALLAHALWETATDDRGQPGYRICRWVDWQAELDAIAQRRSTDRDRKRRERAKSESQRTWR